MLKKTKKKTTGVVPCFSNFSEFLSKDPASGVFIQSGVERFQFEVSVMERAVKLLLDKLKNTSVLNSCVALMDNRRTTAFI